METTMTQKHDNQLDHHADIKNPNRGTPGTNITWDQAQGNRGKQLNPNQESGNEPNQPAPRTRK